jgi:hypothetical protein
VGSGVGPWGSDAVAHCSRNDVTAARVVNLRPATLVDGKRTPLRPCKAQRAGVDRFRVRPVLARMGR